MNDKCQKFTNHLRVISTSQHKISYELSLNTVHLPWYSWNKFNLHVFLEKQQFHSCLLCSLFIVKFEGGLKSNCVTFKVVNWGTLELSAERNTKSQVFSVTEVEYITKIGCGAYL